jgi:hypothetical protein
MVFNINALSVIKLRVSFSKVIQLSARKKNGQECAECPSQQRDRFERLYHYPDSPREVVDLFYVSSNKSLSDFEPYVLGASHGANEQGKVLAQDSKV